MQWKLTPLEAELADKIVDHLYGWWAQGERLMKHRRDRSHSYGNIARSIAPVVPWGAFEGALLALQAGGVIVLVELLRSHPRYVLNITDGDRLGELRTQRWGSPQ